MSGAVEEVFLKAKWVTNSYICESDVDNTKLLLFRSLDTILSILPIRRIQFSESEYIQLRGKSVHLK